MQIRRMRWAAAVVAASLLATACGSDDPTTDGESNAPTEGAELLVVGTTEKPSTIDPAKVYEKMASDFLFNTTDRLVALEPGSGDAVPGVAESWDISEDGLTYTFTLRDGVTFQDGSVLDSEDVKWSLERSLNINHPDGATFLIGGIQSIETPDALTAVITIDAPNVTFLSRLAYTVATILPSDSDVYTAPEEAIADVTVEAADAFMQESTIVGSGPYKLTEYDPDTGATLEAWDGYWGTAPLIPTVKIQFFETTAQMASALEAGEIDVNINDMGPAERTALEAADGVTVEIGDGGRTRYIVLDVTAAPFDRPEVRQAMAAAIDRQRIIDDVFEGAGQPMFSMVPSGFPVAEDFISGATADLGDEVVDIELWYPLNKYGDTEADVAESIARSLNESGNFNVTTQPADWAAEYSGNLNNGVYSAYLLGWYPDYIDADDYIEPFYHSERTFIGFYNSPEMDALIEAEQNETDLAARNAIFSDIQKLAAADMPFIPLYESSAVAYYADGVTGVENSVDVAIAARWYLINKA